MESKAYNIVRNYIEKKNPEKSYEIYLTDKVVICQYVHFYFVSTVNRDATYKVSFDEARKYWFINVYELTDSVCFKETN